MALVPHTEDKEGQKNFKEKLTAGKKGGNKAGADKLKAENNIDVEGKKKISVAI